MIVDPSTAAEKVWLQLTGDDEGRVCRDIPEEACNAQPQNFLRHVVALAATKTGDGLADAKLVLAWLLGALGAPAFLIGFLVPVREAGALLPQLVTAGRIRRLPLRKRAWVVGSLIQGAAVLGMGITALMLEGAIAGWLIVGLLTLMSLARSVCSVSYKDVLGKTVSRSTRGTATGTASTLAAVAVLGFGVLLASGLLPLGVAPIALVLCVAGGLWILAALVFSTLSEQPGATEGGGSALSVVRAQIGLLGTDGQLRRFILVRSLLVATALAPPFLLALAGREHGAELGGLGGFVIASSLAAVTSTYLWGRLADVSSRRVLLWSGLLAALPLALAAILGIMAPSGLQQAPVLPLLLFLLMIAYQGVRLGRSTHVVDMADPDSRAAYTALSNTIVGLVLVLGGAAGFVAGAFGEAILLGLFAAMCLLAALLAAGLEEVQRT
ncbi:MAG: MFS transporter [Gammaproteobacteria bacterium]|nr:MFS transporter [Gammaproteobacteria bacterium]